MKRGCIIDIGFGRLAKMLQGQAPLLALPPDSKLTEAALDGRTLRLKFHGPGLSEVAEGSTYPIKELS